MIVSNYNPLGKVGPHYERPEYRPPAPSRDDEQLPARAGDRRTLSLRNQEGAGQKPTAPVSAAPAPVRLNLASARNLARNLAAQISVLHPQSTDREPHTRLRTSLLPPVYA